MAGCAAKSENAEKKWTRETVFVPVGLAFCELRVSIRVDVKCLGQLTSSAAPLLGPVKAADSSARVLEHARHLSLLEAP
jgi:hypothetical protein